MRRLRVQDSTTDKKLAKKIIGYIERDRWKKLKKLLREEDIHAGSVLNFRSGDTGLHFAAKMGSEESLRVLLKLGADPSVKNNRDNYPLHLSLKHCIKHFSKSRVQDLVQVLLPHSEGILNEPNKKGTTCKHLIECLKLKLDIENEKELLQNERNKNMQSEDENSSAHEEDDSANFQQRLDDEASEEYFEHEGKFQNFDSGEFTEETFNDWADRIYSEYQKKKQLGRSQVTKAPKEEEKPETPKLAGKLKEVKKKENDGDRYLLKSAKLFDSSDEITIKDLPFNLDSTPEQIIECILWKSEDVRSRLRDGLRKWHPDKFMQFVQGRIKDAEEREKIFDVVTHVSQVLINYGK